MTDPAGKNTGRSAPHGMNLEATLREAAMLCRSGHTAHARRLFQQVLERFPHDPDAHHNLGVLTMQEGGPLAQALPHFRAAWLAQPDHAQFGLSYLRALLMAGRQRKAAEVHAEGLRRGLSWPPLASLAGAAAAPAKEKADDAHALAAHGRALRKQNLLSEAEAALRKAAGLRPGSADILTEWGQVLGMLNRYAESETVLNRAAALRPTHVKARFLLGCALLLQDRPDEAIGHFRKILSFEPEHIDARNRLIDCLKRTGRVEEVEAVARKGLRKDPGSIRLLHALAEIYLHQGRVDDADACHRQVLAHHPDELNSRSALLFSGALGSASPAECFASACAWGQLATARAATPFVSWNAPCPPERLRVGLVSGDFRKHPVGYFLETVLAHSDPGRIEWIAYPTITEMDEQSVRLRNAMSDWRPIKGLDDASAARRIHADGVHVLVDLSGHTSLNRLPLFAWRPAPVQVTWLGYFATTGLATIDYLIADEVGVPPEHHDQYTEKIRYLPDTRLCFSVLQTDLLPAALPAQDRNHVCFGCFQRTAKISDAVLDAWSRILAAVPDSRLRWQDFSLFDGSLRSALLTRMKKHGIDPSRVSLHGGTDRDPYLAAHAEVDIVLDTFPYPGGTTTCEALWMGVPTVTLAGDTLIARQGASILRAAGLPDWVAHNPAEYVAIAVHHASDLARLAQLREHMREQVRVSPLFDGARFARHLTDALWGMWQESGARRMAKPSVSAPTEESAGSAVPARPGTP